MKLLVSLGLIAYVSALHDSQCNNFITVKRSRNKRSPQNWWESDDSTTTGGVSTNAASTTVAPTTAGTNAVSTTAAPTTVAPTTVSQAGSTTATQPAVVTTAPDGTTTADSYAVSTEAPIEGEGTDYLILLDATGSMQKLNGPGQGREFVINKFNKFLKTLRTQVERGNIQDGKIIVATFNKAASWVEYNSIQNVEDMSKRTYNPGYGTNLYDTVGCALQKFKQESGAAKKIVYILTDGIHQVKSSTPVAHTVDEVSDMVNEYRDEEGMEFSFLALINPEDKEALKSSAHKMGIRGAEIRTTDFDGQGFSVMLKSMLRGLKKSSKQKPQKLQSCQSLKQKCQKGRGGKMCRRNVQRRKLQGKCA